MGVPTQAEKFWRAGSDAKVHCQSAERAGMRYQNAVLPLALRYILNHYYATPNLRFPMEAREGLGAGLQEHKVWASKSFN